MNLKISLNKKYNKLTYKKVLVLNSKFKNFLGYGSFVGYKNSANVYFFLEDVLKKNNIRYLNIFNMNYDFTFRKIIKRDFIFFSKFFYNFKSSSIYCLTIPYSFFFFFVNFLNININNLKDLNISPLVFIFNGFLYDISFIFSEVEIFKNPYQNIYSILTDIFNFFFMFDKFK